MLKFRTFIPLLFTMLKLLIHALDKDEFARKLHNIYVREYLKSIALVNCNRRCKSFVEILKQKYVKVTKYFRIM